MEKKFIPENPYVFKTGSHQGQTMEDLFFKEAGFITWLKNKSGTLPYQLWQHLVYLIEASRLLEVKMICPVCKQNKVKYFFLLPKNVVSERYTCCDNPTCRQAIRSRYQIEREFLIKFEALEQLPRKELKDKAGRLFKKVFGLPRKLQKNATFELFKKAHLRIDGWQMNLF